MAFCSGCGVKFSEDECTCTDEVMESNKSDRKLKKGGSGAEAPRKKIHKEDASKEAMPAWAQQLMTKMTGVENTVDRVLGQVGEAKAAANEARDEAMEAKVAVTALECEVEKLKDDVGKLKIGEARTQQQQQQHQPTTVGGKGGGKAEKRALD